MGVKREKEKESNIKKKKKRKNDQQRGDARWARSTKKQIFLNLKFNNKKFIYIKFQLFGVDDIGLFDGSISEWVKFGLI